MRRHAGTPRIVENDAVIVTRSQPLLYLAPEENSSRQIVLLLLNFRAYPDSN